MTTTATATETKPTPSTHRLIQEMVADRIIDLLERGEMPPWEEQGRGPDDPGPMNAVSLRPYQGINHWLTLIAREEMGYRDPRWLTLIAREEMGYRDPRWLTPNQVEHLGGEVLEGETDTRLIFWKSVTGKSRENPEQAETFSVLRSYRVFNLEQTRNCRVGPLPECPRTAGSRTERADAIIFNMTRPPSLVAFDDGIRAPEYLPGSDQVLVSRELRQASPESWYNGVFHQLVHSTGHPDRLGRFELDQPAGGLHQPGREELAAAMGAGLLAARAGIGSRVPELGDGFFREWREAIAKDQPMVIRAAAMAQKAVYHILGENPPENRYPGD